MDSKQELDLLKKLEKDLKQLKSNFKNSQTHSRNCYMKLLDRYMCLEKENAKLKKIIVIFSDKIKVLANKCLDDGALVLSYDLYCLYSEVLKNEEF